MDLEQKTEPGSPPVFASNSQRNLKVMSISELVSVLRAAYLMDDFDKVEEVLVARDERLKGEVGSLQEKIEKERLTRVEAEEEMKKREEQYQKGMRALECYQTLLKDVKKSKLCDHNTVEELSKKNHELEVENMKLMELKKKWLDDGNAVAELRIRVGALENEKVELEAGKKDWMHDKNALAALKIRCSELEETVKNNLATIDEHRAENSKLADEKNKAETKFVELNERVERLEEDTKLLMSEEASIGRNTKGEPQADPAEVKKEDHMELSKMDIRDSASLQRNNDARHSNGASGGRSGLENVIEIVDSDDDRCISGRTRGQPIEMLKRRISFSFLDADTSSSSSDSLNLDDLHLCFRDITSNKKSKTEADSRR